jgi:hypothetical protein
MSHKMDEWRRRFIKSSLSIESEICIYEMSSQRALTPSRKFHSGLVPKRSQMKNS